MDINKKVYFLCGVSGSGKSTALNALEDIGIRCIDNLPVKLLGEFSSYVSERLKAEKNDTHLYALLLNLEGDASADEIKAAREQLKSLGLEVNLLFFDAQDDVLLRRFRETRRPHPLLINQSSETTLLDALKSERDRLELVRERADRVFDTSFYSPHELRRNIEDYLNFENVLSVQIKSFGFKYGAPKDADLLMDVRFLPNPHFVPDLREKTGEDSEVKEYVFSSGEAEEFLGKLKDMLEFLLPRYEKEGKRYLTVAIGCTGGKHRSVALSESITEFLKAKNYSVTLRHRDAKQIS